MSYKVEYVVESDAPELGVINYAAFEHRRLLHRMFPETEPSLLGEYKSKHVMKHLVNPETHVLKVRDPETGKIAAYSRWHFPAQRGITPNIPPLSEQALEYAKDPVAFAPQPMNKEVFDAFKALLQDARKRHAKDEDMVLDLLATSPEFQGRGIGSTVLKWGAEQADAHQARIYLEATPDGFHLYESFGWKPVEEISIDFKPFGLEGEENFWIMIRDPVPK